MEPEMPRENYHISASPVDHTSRSETEPEEAVQDKHGVKFEEITGEEENREENKEEDNDFVAWRGREEAFTRSQYGIIWESYLQDRFEQCLDNLIKKGFLPVSDKRLITVHKNHVVSIPLDRKKWLFTPREHEDLPDNEEERSIPRTVIAFLEREREKNNLVFDLFLTVKRRPRGRPEDIIVEAKLSSSRHAIGLKDLAYLYYFPHATLWIVPFEVKSRLLVKSIESSFSGSTPTESQDLVDLTKARYLEDHLKKLVHWFNQYCIKPQAPSKLRLSDVLRRVRIITRDDLGIVDVDVKTLKLLDHYFDDLKSAFLRQLPTNFQNQATMTIFTDPQLTPKVLKDATTIIAFLKKHPRTPKTRSEFPGDLTYHSSIAIHVLLQHGLIVEYIRKGDPHTKYYVLAWHDHLVTEDHWWKGDDMLELTPYQRQVYQTLFQASVPLSVPDIVKLTGINKMSVRNYLKLFFERKILVVTHVRLEWINITTYYMLTDKADVLLVRLRQDKIPPAFAEKWKPYEEKGKPYELMSEIPFDVQEKLSYEELKKKIAKIVEHRFNYVAIVESLVKNSPVPIAAKNLVEEIPFARTTIYQAFRMLRDENKIVKTHVANVRGGLVEYYVHVNNLERVLMRIDHEGNIMLRSKPETELYEELVSQWNSLPPEQRPRLVIDAETRAKEREVVTTLRLPYRILTYLLDHAKRPLSAREIVRALDAEVSGIRKIGIPKLIGNAPTVDELAKILDDDTPPRLIITHVKLHSNARPLPFYIPARLLDQALQEARKLRDAKGNPFFPPETEFLREWPPETQAQVTPARLKHAINEFARTLYQQKRDARATQQAGAALPKGAVKAKMLKVLQEVDRPVFTQQLAQLVGSDGVRRHLNNMLGKEVVVTHVKPYRNGIQVYVALRGRVEELMANARLLTDHRGNTLFPENTEFLATCDINEQQRLSKKELTKRIKKFAQDQQK